MEPELEENTVVKKGFSWEIPGLHTEINYLMRKERWKRQEVFKKKNQNISEGESSTGVTRGDQFFWKLSFLEKKKRRKLLQL